MINCVVKSFNSAEISQDAASINQKIIIKRSSLIRENNLNITQEKNDIRIKEGPVNSSKSVISELGGSPCEFKSIFELLGNIKNDEPDKSSKTSAFPEADYKGLFWNSLS